ncbi:hypothetical protein RCL1_002914 [Eukaryota sp. TZLM3-RCL]
MILILILCLSLFSSVYCSCVFFDSSYQGLSDGTFEKPFPSFTDDARTAVTNNPQLCFLSCALYDVLLGVSVFDTISFSGFDDPHCVSLNFSSQSSFNHMDFSFASSQNVVSVSVSAEFSVLTLLSFTERAFLVNSSLSTIGGFIFNLNCDSCYNINVVGQYIFLDGLSGSNSLFLTSYSELLVSNALAASIDLFVNFSCFESEMHSMTNVTIVSSNLHAFHLSKPLYLTSLSIFNSSFDFGNFSCSFFASSFVRGQYFAVSSVETSLDNILIGNLRVESSNLLLSSSVLNTVFLTIQSNLTLTNLSFPACFVGLECFTGIFFVDSYSLTFSQLFFYSALDVTITSKSGVVFPSYNGIIFDSPTEDAVIGSLTLQSNLIVIRGLELSQFVPAFILSPFFIDLPFVIEISNVNLSSVASHSVFKVSAKLLSLTNLTISNCSFDNIISHPVFVLDFKYGKNLLYQQLYVRLNNVLLDNVDWFVVDLKHLTVSNLSLTGNCLVPFTFSSHPSLGSFALYDIYIFHASFLHLLSVPSIVSSSSFANIISVNSSFSGLFLFPFNFSNSDTNIISFSFSIANSHFKYLITSSQLFIDILLTELYLNNCTFQYGVIQAPNSHVQFSNVGVVNCNSSSSLLISSNNSSAIVVENWLSIDNCHSPSGVFFSAYLNISFLNLNFNINEFDCLFGCLANALCADISFYNTHAHHLLFSGKDLINVVTNSTISVSSSSFHLTSSYNHSYLFFSNTLLNYSVVNASIDSVHNIKFFGTLCSSLQPSDVFIYVAPISYCSQSFLINSLYFETVSEYDSMVFHYIQTSLLLNQSRDFHLHLFSLSPIHLRVNNEIMLLRVEIFSSFSINNSLYTLMDKSSSYIKCRPGQVKHINMTFLGVSLSHTHFCQDCDFSYEYSPLLKSCQPCPLSFLRLNLNDSFCTPVKGSHINSSSAYDIPNGFFVVESNENNSASVVKCTKPIWCIGGRVQSGYSGASWSSMNSLLSRHQLFNSSVTRFRNGCSFGRYGNQCAFCEAFWVSEDHLIGDESPENSRPIIRQISSGNCIICPSLYYSLISLILSCLIFLVVFVLYFTGVWRRLIVFFLPVSGVTEVKSWLVRAFTVLLPFYTSFVHNRPSMSLTYSSPEPRFLFNVSSITLCLMRYLSKPSQAISFNQYCATALLLFNSILFVLTLICCMAFVFQKRSLRSNAVKLLELTRKRNRELESLFFVFAPFAGGFGLLHIIDLLVSLFTSSPTSYLDPRYIFSIDHYLLLLSFFSIGVVVCYLFLIAKYSVYFVDESLYKPSRITFDVVVIVGRSVLGALSTVYGTQTFYLTVLYLCLIFFLLMFQRPFAKEYFNDFTSRIIAVTVICLTASMVYASDQPLLFHFTLILTIPVVVYVVLSKSRSQMLNHSRIRVNPVFRML